MSLELIENLRQAEERTEQELAQMRVSALMTRGFASLGKMSEALVWQAEQDLQAFRRARQALEAGNLEDAAKALEHPVLH